MATVETSTTREPEIVMQRTNELVRTGGIWFAIASFLMIVVLVLHGPIAPDLDEQMTRVSGMATKWAVAHWIAAAALSLYAVAALIVLTSRETAGGFWTTTAWAVVAIGALWTLTTAVVEATVVTDAARSGDTELFYAWWAFAEGKASGFAFVALAIALIAGNAARSARATPAWAAWLGMVAGSLSFIGWALGMWLGIRPANLLWVVATIVLSTWGVWFGLRIRAEG